MSMRDDAQYDNFQDYDMMRQYLQPMLNQGRRKFVGREQQVKEIEATLNRDEISNVALVADAGTGKTSIVMMCVDKLPNWDFFEVRLSLMAAGVNGRQEMPARMTQLIDEVVKYQSRTKKQLVLFMDEFHVIMEQSPAAMEAIKPVLANSGRRGVRIIIATTFDEYDKYVRGNEALTERLERIEVPELTTEETLSALRNYCDTYLHNMTVSDQLLLRIIEVTNRALPSQRQPRKSLRILDAMAGWYKTFHGSFDAHLLAERVKSSIGVNIDWAVNVAATENYFNHRVLDQTLATTAVVNRLYISVADLNDDGRPRGSFLFTGPTGVGKTELSKAMANRLFGSDDAMIRFDMSEYSDPRDADLFRDRLTTAIWAHPSSVVLLDEVEKSSPEANRLLLQVLDDARLTDAHGKTMSFKDSYIVMTTNAGANVYQELQKQFGSKAKVDPQQQQEMLRSYYPLIERTLSRRGKSENGGFPPELLGRVDQIVPFAAINFDTRAKITDIQLQKLANLVYQKHHVYLHIDKRVKDFIVYEHVGRNTANSGGGRTLKRKIDQTITGQVARVLVDYPTVKDLAVVVAGRMATGNKYDIKGNAHIQVGRWAG